MTARDDGDGSLGSLARMGFIDPDRAQRLLQSLGPVAEPLVPLIARSADPDQALTGLVDLADAASDRDALLQEVADDEGTSMRLLSVLGSSVALGEHLRRHPDQWHELEDPTLG
ncbi:MAG: bifunctional glutamine-synthetase adenylyltransferase/deadenyltransferase, partial [Marmoricola sp.]|nr:bifunctional glutamine-synthetase adenylyltransferase/deadenyltransferase [Marmoricola sp.]